MYLVCCTLMNFFFFCACCVAQGTGKMLVIRNKYPETPVLYKMCIADCKLAHVASCAMLMMQVIIEINTRSSPGKS